jgi:tight adherence protein B
MRWLAVVIFIALSVYFLLRRSSARAGLRARNRLRRHFGMPAQEKERGSARRFLSRGEWLDRTRYLRGLRELFERAAIKISWVHFKLVWILSLLAIPALAHAVSGSPFMIPPAALAAYFLPIPFLRLFCRRADRKAAEKCDQFAADLALYLRCGIPLEEATGLIAQDYGPPLAASLAQFQKEANASSRPGEALQDLAKSLGNSDLDLISQAVIASRETGSDVRGVMEAVGDALRERAAIRRELDTQTIQSRLSGRIVAALPLVFLGLSALVSRGTLQTLFGTAPGLIMLAAALVLDLLGFLWIRRILDIET